MRLVVDGGLTPAQFVVNMPPRGRSFAAPYPRAREHGCQEDGHVLDHVQPHDWLVPDWVELPRLSARHLPSLP